jgi:class 3 adenylate cyclase
MTRPAVTEADGTVVKNLADGLMVVFGPTSAALACAVAMQQSVRASGRAARTS